MPGRGDLSDPHPSSLTIPRKKRIKATPKTVWAPDFLDLPRSGLETPPGTASPLKSLLDTVLVSWSFT